MVKNFDEEFDLIRDKLLNKEPFAFTRFSDGECFILQNKRLILGDGFYVTGDKAGGNIYGPEEHKEFDPEKDQAFRQMLIESFEHEQHNYLKGVPSKQDVHVDFDYGNEKGLTFANLLINANYKRFISEIALTILPERTILYVVNERADLSGLPFDVDKDFRIGSNCTRDSLHVVDEVITYLVDLHNDILEFPGTTMEMKEVVVLCSAASLSNIIIHEGFKVFPEVTFLDIGSALNPYLGENMQSCMHTRDYLRSYWLKEKTHYGEQIDTWA